MAATAIQLLAVQKVTAQETELPVWVTNPPLAEEGEIIVVSSDEHIEGAMGIALAEMLDELPYLREEESYITPGVSLAGYKAMIQIGKKTTGHNTNLGRASESYREHISLTIVLNDKLFFNGVFEIDYRKTNAQGMRVMEELMEAAGDTSEISVSAHRSIFGYRQSGPNGVEELVKLLMSEDNRQLKYTPFSNGDFHYGMLETTKDRFLKGNIDFEIPEAKAVFGDN